MPFNNGSPKDKFFCSVHRKVLVFVTFLLSTGYVFLLHIIKISDSDAFGYSAHRPPFLEPRNFANGHPSNAAWFCNETLRHFLEFESWKWVETERHNIHQKDSSSQCDSYARQGRLKYGNSTNIFDQTVDFKCPPNDITLAVHLTADRLDKLLMLAQHWSGPISAAVYVSNIQDSSMIDNLCQFSTASNIFIHVLHAVGDIYPANILRNFALEEVFTEYVFLSDVDFMPDFSLYNASVDFIQHNERHLNSSAFVVAAFEILNDSKTWGQPVQFPRNKTELIDLWGAQKLQPFHFSKTKNYGHIETNYEKWTVAHEIYAVTWMPYYEPYVIVRTSTVPRYHNAFVGRYFDKTSHLMELYYAGYEFWVLPDSFVVHLPHAHQKSGIGHYSCANDQFHAFKSQLEKTYGKKQDNNNTTSGS